MLGMECRLQQHHRFAPRVSRSRATCIGSGCALRCSWGCSGVQTACLSIVTLSIVRVRRQPLHPCMYVHAISSVDAQRIQRRASEYTNWMALLHGRDAREDFRQRGFHAMAIVYS